MARRREWWERSTEIYSRKRKIDPQKHQKETADFIKKFQKDTLEIGKKISETNIEPLPQEEIDEYLTKFRKDVKKIRERMLKK